MLDLSEYVIEFVLKLAMNADKMNEVEIDPSNTSVHINDISFSYSCTIIGNFSCNI